VTLITDDVRDTSAVHKITKGMDAVIHMATFRITACFAEPREALSVMCDGSFNVIEAAHAAEVRKIVAASSASIYAAAEVFHNPYGDGKAAARVVETLLRGPRKADSWTSPSNCHSFPP